MRATLVSAICAGCRCFPCRCELAETRTERCACGGSITAIAGNWDDITEEVASHSQRPRHVAWKAEQDAVKASRRPTVRPCPCHGVPAT